MAIEKIIKIIAETGNAENQINKVSTATGKASSSAKKAEISFDDLGNVIREQKSITIEFEKELRRLELQLRNTSKANLPAQKILKEKILDIKDALKDQRISLKELKNEQSSATKVTEFSTKKLAENSGAIQILDQFTGGMASQFRSAADATKLFNTSLKATKGAIIATGIGALVVALGLVIAYWDEIVDFISGANNKLEKQHKLLETNISLFDSELKFLEKKSKFNIANGISNKETLKKQKEILEQKRLLLKEDIKLLEAQLLKEESIAKEATLWEKLQAFRVGGTATGFIDEEERKRLKDLRLQINALKGDVVDIDLSLLDTSDKKPKTKRDKETSVGSVDTAEEQQAKRDKESEFFEEQLGLKQYREKTLADVTISEDLRLTMEQVKQSESRIAQAEKEANDRIIFEENVSTAKKELAINTFNLLGNLAKKGSALAKGVAVSQAVISTYQGINKALAETTDPTPTQSLRFANAAAVGIAGFLNVAKILSTKESSKGGGAQSASSASAPSFNLVQGTGSNQIAQSLQTGQDPIRAYVVSSEVTTSQSLDRNIEGEASL